MPDGLRVAAFAEAAKPAARERVEGHGSSCQLSSPIT